MKSMNTIFIITGPTASGKTELSLSVAEKHGCEIICMDSMQIYRGMDIGTAKPTAAERLRVPHHMLDVADPREDYSVARYTEEAVCCAEDILARGKKPLFVGGTGFYLRALRHPMAMGGTPANPTLRDALQREAMQPGGDQRLHDRLQQVDPVTAQRLHVHDVRRVIRALEVWSVTGIPFSRQKPPEETQRFVFRAIALSMDRHVLYERINQRVDRMLREGLVHEVQTLLSAGVPEDAQSMKALGYKEILPFLRGECSLEEAAESIRQGSRRYAKRQLTWLRREEDLLWLDPTEPVCMQQIEDWFFGGDHT